MVGCHRRRRREAWDRRLVECVEDAWRMADGRTVKQPLSRRVYIVDDEPGICDVLRKTLERAGMVVSCFGDMESCLACLGSETCDLLVTDVRMPGGDGIALLKEVRRRQPWIPVLVMTGFGDVPTAVEALKAGAADFVEKPLERNAFLKLVRALVAHQGRPSAAANRPLTQMEAKILQHILEGRSNRQIADLLHRSPRTVEVHRRHMMRKMGAANIVELVRRATEYRLPGSGTLMPGPASHDDDAREGPDPARSGLKMMRAHRRHA